MKNINQIIRDLSPERRAKVSTRAAELEMAIAVATGSETTPEYCAPEKDPA